MSMLDGFLEAAVRGATPLAFAAAGALCTERAGVLNLSLEGTMAVGALAGFTVASTAGSTEAVLAGGLAGMAVAVCFAVFVLLVRAQQILAGMAISMLGIGLAATLHRVWVVRGESSSPVETLTAIPVPLLSDIPIVGPAFMNQPWPTYVLYLLFPFLGWVFYRTSAGIVMRAVGEAPDAARASGHEPRTVQAVAILGSGLLAGMGGATLVVAQTGAFSDTMTAGRGYVAIAIVALGRHHPSGVALTSLVFGGVGAVQFLAQAFDWQVAYGLVLAAPYVAALAALGLFRRRRLSFR